MRQYFEASAFADLRETGRCPVGFGVQIELIENSGRALRGQFLRFFGQALQLVHLLRRQQQVGVHPAFHSAFSAHAYQTPASLDDVEAVSVFDLHDAGRFGGQILPQVHSGGADVSDADGGQAGRYLRWR